jgi:hypothetical protein
MLRLSTRPLYLKSHHLSSTLAQYHLFPPPWLLVAAAAAYLAVGWLVKLHAGNGLLHARVEEVQLPEIVTSNNSSSCKGKLPRARG